MCCERDKLFKMAQKNAQRNEYQKKVTLGYHRNPEIVCYVLLTSNANIYHCCRLLQFTLLVPKTWANYLHALLRAVLLRHHMCTVVNTLCDSGFDSGSGRVES